MRVESARNRRRGHGRRWTDLWRNAYDPLVVRGLLHDLGHQMTTLSYLVEAMRGETDLSGDVRVRMETLALGMSQVLETLTQGIPGAPSAAEISTVDLRCLASQTVQLAQVGHGVSVELVPGPDVTLEANPVLLWRVLTNVIENAARATGPGGKVEIRINDQLGAAIDVTDDGPGFGRGPSGTAFLGLSVVTSLLESCGGSLEVQSPQAGGTRISIRLPATCSGKGKEPAGDSL